MQHTLVRFLEFFETFTMPVKIIEQQIQKTDLLDLELKSRDGALVKAVVDIGKEIMIAGMTMHSDGEEVLLESGSKQVDLWGINLYLQQSGEDWIEYDSVINLRPSQGNSSRGVDDPVIRQKIREIVNQLIKQL
jgi:hypothetical protein